MLKKRIKNGFPTTSAECEHQLRDLNKCLPANKLQYQILKKQKPIPIYKYKKVGMVLQKMQFQLSSHYVRAYSGRHTGTRVQLSNFVWRISLRMPYRINIFSSNVTKKKKKRKQRMENMVELPHGELVK